MRARLRGEPRDQRRVQSAELAAELGQRSERGLERCELARPGGAQRDAREYPLHVADAPQERMQRFVPSALEQRLDRVQTQLTLGAVTQRAREPAFELASTHGGGGAVEHSGERAVGPLGQRNLELEIAPGRRVDEQRLAPLLAAQTAQMRERRALRVAH